jgi:hypothetical protein
MAMTSMDSISSTLDGRQVAEQEESPQCIVSAVFVAATSARQQTNKPANHQTTTLSRQLADSTCEMVAGRNMHQSVAN